MAWKLRQPFEGDRIISVSGVNDTGTCWWNNGAYVPNSIAIKIGTTQYPLASITSLTFGFLVFQVPDDIFISANSPVQVYALCEDLPDSKTATLSAKPIDFKITNSAVVACNPQVILNSSMNEWVRVFMHKAAGNFFNLKLNNTNLDFSSFGYQTGDSGNVISAAGNWSRPSADTTDASIISNENYSGNNTITITPASTNYFTVRLGYLEVIFSGTDLKYNNYLNSSEVEVSAGTYAVGNVITIESTPNQYVLRRNGTVITTKSKPIHYEVNGGSITPVNSTVGTPVAWMLPTSAGSYTFIATVGDSLKFQKSVYVHSCATAVNDSFTGVYNTPYVGNVNTNDKLCTGENNYLEVLGTPIGGYAVINASGSFLFTPTANFNGTARFTYRRRCGTSFETSEVIATAVVTINYYDPCNGVAANYQDNGQTRCENCVEQKQRVDSNAQCTGNAPIWVANPGGTKCNRATSLIATGETRCQNCVNQREMQDMNACSPTYQQKTWVNNPGGTNCNGNATWQDNGVFECQNCIEKKQQQDTNPCSPSYNSLQWVNNPSGTKCNRVPAFQDTNQFLCENCTEYKKQRDINSCSSTFNNTINVLNPTGNSCTREPNWIEVNQTRCVNNVHQKLRINNNLCSEETEEWVNTQLDICSCIAQIRIKNNCYDGVTITGVEVYKAGVIENNRLISFENDWVKFNTDVGTFNYIITLHHSNGNYTKINILQHKCNPII